MLNVVSCL
jgi:hypothetical protein